MSSVTSRLSFLDRFLTVWIFTAMLIGIFVHSLLYSALFEDPYTWVIAGAAIAILYEPLGDFLVLAFYPVRHQIGWVEMFGHQVPLFIEVLYFWYFCPFVLVFVRLAKRGFTARTWWG